ncbi:MAG: hypothetical protein HY795_16895 [Desulfovibrio sp.]|nr:hypothetical protein [Desulfovibrio sp.]MBI4961601.1 hypothetical protein [Desulfovibrio sp.]
MAIEKKKLCILHGNCQGETLAALLSASPEFASGLEVEFYVNFTRQAIPEESLSRCGLFLHQHLGANWGELSSESLKARLPRNAAVLCYPNMLFKGYWPFWSNRAGFDYSDSLLDGLLERGLAKAEALHVALKGNLDRMFGLAGLLADTLGREREKESLCDVPYVDLIEDAFRHEKLFQSVNHPRKRLMVHVAQTILARLGLPPLPDGFQEACPELYPDFELPIHPQVAAFHGLTFGGEGWRFNVYGQPMTYAEYIGLYLDCKLAGRGDFIRYLHGE